MAIYDSIVDTIGSTPLVALRKLFSGKATVLGKLEGRNPLASVKDRIGQSMIEAAEREGKLKPGSLIVEPTSGNTGIALAFVAAARGYKLVLTMPDSMSIERRKVLRFLGADVVLTPAIDGMQGAIDKAREIVRESPKAFMPQQFENPANPEIHRRTTAVEIWNDTAGKVDIIVSGVGTGGTITGIAEALKPKKPSLQMVAVEPLQSPVLTQTLQGKPLTPGAHKIQGIGAGFVPKVLNLKLIDEVVAVDQNEALDWARQAARTEGVFVGISSGAALAATAELLKRDDCRNKTIVVILPSFGERYISTALFENIEG